MNIRIEFYSYIYIHIYHVKSAIELILLYIVHVQVILQQMFGGVLKWEYPKSPCLFQAPKS